MSELDVAHSRLLWGLCYRITGVAADADELVQEVALRALDVRHASTADFRGWTVRVATNLACDRLRRRRREDYLGVWLPTPVAFEEAAPASLLEQRECVSLAFLVALEVLTPAQRAVLVLRDVFEQSAAEVAQSLELSEENVRMLHHRARRRLEAWRAHPPATDERVGHALERFATALSEGDSDALLALLRDDVIELVDGRGDYHSAKVPLVGPRRVATFNRRLLQIRGFPASAQTVVLNGQPCLLLDFEARRPTEAPRNVISLTVAVDGRVSQILSFVAPRKLTHVQQGPRLALATACPEIELGGGENRSVKSIG